MKNYWGCLFIILSICLSCIEKKVEPVSMPMGQKINLDSLDAIEMCSLKAVRYVPVETTEDFLVSDVSKVICYDSLYYLFDKGGKACFVIDGSGKCVNRIHQIGNGPGEYVDVWDMDVDIDRNIWFYDLSMMKLIKYRCNGSRLDFKEYRINKQSLFMAVSDSTTCFLSHLYEQGNLTDWLGCYDLESGEYTSLIGNEESWNLPYLASTYFFRSQDELYYYKKHDKYIYRIVGKETLPFIELASAHFPTKTDLEACQEKKSPIPLYYAGKVGEVNALYATTNFVYIGINKIPNLHLFINRENKKLYKVAFSEESDLNGRLKLVGATKDHFIGYYQPTPEVLEVLKNRDEKIKENLATLTEESNPILVLLTVDGEG